MSDEGRGAEVMLIDAIALARLSSLGSSFFEDEKKKDMVLSVLSVLSALSCQLPLALLRSWVSAEVLRCRLLRALLFFSLQQSAAPLLLSEDNSLQLYSERHRSSLFLLFNSNKYPIG